MKIRTNILIFIFASVMLFTGCSKSVEEYNKPAVYWYGKIISSVADEDLEQADSYYSSLQGEHIGSPLLPEATLILAIAHMHLQEYLLSEHFANEYIKRYANANEREFLDFLKIKAKYMALPNPRRDQVLMQNAIKDSEIFKATYPRSMYYAIVDTMLTNLRMAEAALNESIAQLYERLDKPKAAEYYRNIKPQAWIDWNQIDRAQTPWYREWFEGDGTESWYSYLIPDTQSVVSRHANIEQDTLSDLNTTDLDEQTQTQEILDEVTPKEPKELTDMQKYELQRTKELVEKGVLTQEDFKEIEQEIINNR